VTEVAPRVNGVGKVTVPVKTGEASGAYDVELKAFDPSVPPAPMLSVELSVPARVRVLLTVRTLPEASFEARYDESHAAGVLPAVEMTTKVSDVEGARVVIVVGTDVWTVTAPVLLLLIWNDSPRTRVAVDGSTTVWVVEPVKYWIGVLADVNVVVPAAVAVVVYPSSKLLTVVLAVLS
jgi:hypothetical protein